MTSEALSVISLNERSLIRALWVRGTSSRFCIFEVAPVFNILAPVFNRIADWFRQAEKHVPATQLQDWQTKIGQDPNFFERQDLFHRIEPWIAERFKFAQTQNDQIYGMAYRQLVSTYCANRFASLFALREFTHAEAGHEMRLIGFSADTIDLLHALESVDSAPSSSERVGSVLNILLYVLITLYGVAWVIGHLRALVRSHSVFFMADYVWCGNYMELIRAIQQRGKEVILVPPRVLATECRSQTDGCQIVGNEDGRFGILSGLIAIAEIVRDSFNLVINHWSLDPQIFRQLVSCPVRRIRYRALLNKFNCEYFYSRDIYNTDHMMRSYELRRVGATSLGAMQNIPSWTIHQFSCRYLDYDILYLIGKGLHRHYKDTWQPKMELRPGFTLRITRELFQKSKQPRSKVDIAIFIVAAPDWPFMLEFVKSVAARFDDRTIYVKVKEGYRDLESDKSVREVLSEVGNIVISDENSYSLVTKVAFAFSNPSTIIPESIQLGAKTFAIDAPDLLKSYYFRNFPDLCISSAQQAIDRIEMIENGSWSYPRDSYDGVVPYPDRHYLDIILEDIGLEVQSPLEAENNDIHSAHSNLPLRRAVQ